MVGIDALWRAFGEEAEDAKLLATAIAEKRVLLTRDRDLYQRTPEELRYYVQETDPTLQFKEVLRQFDLVAYARGKTGFLTRCLQCNSPILPVQGHQIADRLPGHVIEQFREFYLCPRCERVYWNGSHVDRMKLWLDRVL